MSCAYSDALHGMCVNFPRLRSSIGLSKQLKVKLGYVSFYIDFSELLYWICRPSLEKVGSPASPLYYTHRTIWFRLVRYGTLAVYSNLNF